jgi:hypothetical protein
MTFMRCWQEIEICPRQKRDIIFRLRAFSHRRDAEPAVD